MSNILPSRSGYTPTLLFDAPIQFYKFTAASVRATDCWPVIIQPVATFQPQVACAIPDYRTNNNTSHQCLDHGNKALDERHVVRKGGGTPALKPNNKPYFEP
jgi:hypothetical protein